jgi:hypothetical protein
MKVIIIIYLKYEPYLCFSFKNFDFKFFLSSCKQFCYCNIFFTIEFWNTNIYDKNSIDVHCKIDSQCQEKFFSIGMNTYNFNFDNFDISNNPNYPLTPGKITPVWVKNDHGKQITFLIE